MEGRRFAAVLILTICVLAPGAVASRRPALCSLPTEMGPCLANKQRFYFHWASKECRQFTYGGCKGNGNNFNTTKDCYDACGQE
nr:conkunitzin M14 [Conus magus]